MRLKDLLILILGLFFPVVIYGDVADLGILKDQYRTLEAQRNILEGKRLEIEVEAEALSDRVDSLKLEEDSEELHEALRSSLGFVRRMVEIDRRLAKLDVRKDSLAERLHLVYDWEIGVLIRKLSDQPDKGLLTQLMVYQEAREELGSKTHGSSLRYDEQMMIGGDDGPDEIQQKLDLMKDIANRLQAELGSTAQILLRLEEEYRLRTWMGNSSLKERNVEGAQGRFFLRGESQGEPVSFRDHEGVPNSEIDPVSPSVEEVLLEIHKLKARQQEIRQLQTVVQDRAEAFHLYLRTMLEGKE